MSNDKNRCRCSGNSDKGACQFAGLKSRLIEFEGKYYCVFHLPVDNDRSGISKLFSEKAGWSVKKVKQFNQTVLNIITVAIKHNTAANLDGIVFPENISFDSLMNQLPTANTHEMKQFPPISFRYAVFSKDVLFERIRFTHDVDFRGVLFQGNASFNDSSFESYASFTDVVFNHHASFRGTGFFGNSWFSRTRFLGEANFSGQGVFNEIENIFFKETQFESLYNFNSRKFIGAASFEDARFSETSLTRNSSPYSLINVIKSKFVKQDAQHKSKNERFVKQFAKQLEDNQNPGYVLIA